MDRLLRCAHGFRSGALFAAIALGGFAGASQRVSAANLLILENIVLSNPSDNTEVTIPRVEFAESNLDRSDAEKLFSTKLSPAEERDLIARLKAASIAIAEIRVKSPGGSAELHDLRAENVDSGRIGRLSLAGADVAAVNNKGDVKIVSQALRIDLCHGVGHQRIVPHRARRSTARPARPPRAAYPSTQMIPAWRPVGAPSRR